MRDVPGRQLPVNGRTVYVEESGQGRDWVVFEAGGSTGSQQVRPQPAPASKTTQSCPWPDCST